MDRVSVVIPTQGRTEALPRTLAALDRQELGDVEIELIVVCSGQARESWTDVRELVSRANLEARVLARVDGGAAGARNAGVGAADAELILFLNDDTPPLSPDFIRTHVEIHAASPNEWRGVLGPSIWDREIEVTPVMDWLARTGKMHDYAGLDGAGARPTHLLYANNLSMRKGALTKVDGFDERFWRYGWAEYDLALRLIDRGFEVQFVPDLVVGHHHRYSLRDSLHRMESVGRGANLFNRIHRERNDLVTPAPTGVKAVAGRALAPFAPYVPVPAWLPVRLRDRVFQTLHFAMLARGYARSPIPEGSGPEGGIPGRVEQVA